MNEKEITDLLDLLKTYWNEVKFVGDTKRSVEDVRLYLKSLEANDKQIKRHIKSLRNNEVSLFLVDSEKVTLDRDKIVLVQEQINSILSQGSGVIGPCITREDLLQVQTSKQSIQKELTDLKKQLKAQTDLVDSLTQDKSALEEKLLTVQQSHEQQLTQLQESHADELKKEKQTIRKLRREKGKIPLATHTLILDSQQIYPKEKREENNENGHTVVEIPVPKPAKDNILSKLNYKYRMTREALTEAILNTKIMRLLKKHNKEKFKSDNELVKELLGSKEYTNQQKLALYAAFSDYRSSDFEQLLNFAGDSNLDADLVIMWVESLGDKLDYLQMKNSLRQFAKPSEYQLKHRFAKELLLGKWYVEYEVDGKPTVFRLVSEDDLNNMKELLSLPEQAFTYTMLEEEEKTEDSKPVKEEKQKPSIKERAKAISDKFKAPDFVKTMPVKKEDLGNEQVG